MPEKPRVFLEIGAGAYGTVGVDRILIREWFKKKSRRPEDVLFVSDTDGVGPQNPHKLPLPKHLKGIFKPYSKIIKSPFRSGPEYEPLTEMREKGLQCYGINTPGQCTPFRDGTVHEIIAKNVLGSPPLISGEEREDILDEMHRILKPGGKAVIAETYTPDFGQLEEIRSYLKKRGYRTTLKRIKGNFFDSADSKMLVAKKPESS